MELTEAAVTSQVQAPTKAHLTDRLLSEGGGTLRLRHRLSHSDVHSRQPQRDTGVQRNQGLELEPPGSLLGRDFIIYEKTETLTPILGLFD